MIDDQRDPEVSILAVLTFLIERRWTILKGVFLGGALAAVLVVGRPRRYAATAAFLAGDEAQSSMSLVGMVASQFSIPVQAGDPSESPDFYIDLLGSRVILEPIVLDSFRVGDADRESQPLLDLLEVEAPTTAERTELGVEALRKMLTTSLARETGVVDIRVVTEWPNVSFAIVRDLLSSVNDFNQRTRQRRAGMERRFVEERMAVGQSELRAAEDSLQVFIQRNRQFSGSPELSLEFERRQRVVDHRQAVLSALAQTYEQVRVREVRDTPVITVVEPPAVGARPEPRGRFRAGLLGMVLGGIFGLGFAFCQHVWREVLRSDDKRAGEFRRALREFGREVRAPLAVLTSRFEIGHDAANEDDHARG